MESGGHASAPCRVVVAACSSARSAERCVSLVANSHVHPYHMRGNGALDEICAPQFAAPAAEAAWLEDNGLLGERVRIDRLPPTATRSRFVGRGRVSSRRVATVRVTSRCTILTGDCFRRRLSHPRVRTEQSPSRHTPRRHRPVESGGHAKGIGREKRSRATSKASGMVSASPAPISEPPITSESQWADR